MAQRTSEDHTGSHSPAIRSLAGILLGTAVGDALGLPTEGLSPSRQRKWWPGPLRHRFLFDRGMVSDDTEHAFMTAQALLAARGDVNRFRRSLAWQLRGWFAAIPAGVGLATARSCLRLWMGVPAERSGVHSAGNGPAMRSAIIGAVFAADAGRRREFVRASTRLTHLDSRAETAALAVAEAAALAFTHAPCSAASLRPESSPPGGSEIQLLAQLADDGEWRQLCAAMEAALELNHSTEQFAQSLGLHRGVTGYAYHTVPVALYAWLRNRGDFEATLTGAVRCGGDTDTVAAICGALAGCDAGAEGIPKSWRDGLQDWPRSGNRLAEIARELAVPNGKPIRWFWPGVLPRNLFFFVIVLFHGFRRMLPPY